VDAHSAGAPRCVGLSLQCPSKLATVSLWISARDGNMAQPVPQEEGARDLGSDAPEAADDERCRSARGHITSS